MKNIQKPPQIERRIRLQEIQNDGNSIDVKKYKECNKTPSKFINVIIKRLITI